MAFMSDIMDQLEQILESNKQGPPAPKSNPSPRSVDGPAAPRSAPQQSARSVTKTDAGPAPKATKNDVKFGGTNKKVADAATITDPAAKTQALKKANADALKKAQAEKHTSAGEDFVNGAGWLGGKLGAGAKALGGGLEDAGSATMSALKLFAPDADAWGNIGNDLGDIASAALTDKDFADIKWDTDAGDLANAALDASVFIPGVGLVSGTAGKAALRAGGRLALREVGTKGAAKAAATTGKGLLGRAATAGGKAGAAAKKGLLGEVKDASGNVVTYASRGAGKTAGKTAGTASGKTAGQQSVRGALPGTKPRYRMGGPNGVNGYFNPKRGGKLLDLLEGAGKRVGPGNSRALDVALGRRRGGVVGALTGAGKVPLGLRAGTIAARNSDLDILKSLFGSDGGDQQDKYAGFDEQVPDVVVGPDGLYYYGGGGASVGNGGGLSLQELGSTLGVENLQDLAEYVSKR